MENSNDRSILTPQQIFILLLATFGFVIVFGAIAVLIGGTTLGLLSESLIILPPLCYLLYKRYPLAASFRFGRIDLFLVLNSLLIAFVLFVLSDELDRLVNLYFPMPPELMQALVRLLRITSITDALVLFFAAVLMAGFAEEMLFRGLLQRTLEHYRDPAMAIVLTSVLFALAHFNPWVALQITFLGLALGYMAWKSRSILPAVIVHSGNNMLSIVLINTSQEELSWYATEEHVRWIWIVLALVLIGPAFLAFSRYCEQIESRKTQIPQ